MKVWEHINTLKYNTGNSFAIASVTDYLIIAHKQFDNTNKSVIYAETCVFPYT